jgi:lysozyme
MDIAVLKQDLTRDEEHRGSAYRDSAGNYTIGVGHLIGESPRILTLNDDEIDAFLDRDIANATSLARECVPNFDLLDPVRQRALVNMAFNRGGRMKTSATITPAIVKAAAIPPEGTWTEVRAAIVASPWASQVKDRAIRIADMLVDGTPG